MQIIRFPSSLIRLALSCPSRAVWLPIRAMPLHFAKRRIRPFNTFHKGELDGADRFAFEEFGVRSEAESFQQLGLHLL